MPATTSAAGRLTSPGLLVLLGLVGFALALTFVPADQDDLILLSSVANVRHPLSYFVGDWGLGNNAYRPLHSLSLWLGYRVFGVWAFPNQVINLALHLLNALLVLRIARRVQPDAGLSFLAASLVLFSAFTRSAAAWGSDRPSLLVALFVLLLLDRMVTGEEEADGIGLPGVALLSGLALMSKESGLVVPVLALGLRPRAGVIAVTGGMLAAYAALRWGIFGSEAVSYSESGHLLGMGRYDDWAALPVSWRAAAAVENVARSLIAPLLPVFGDEGGLLPKRDLVLTAPLWLSTALLVGASVDRRPSQGQQVALLLLAANALVHCTIFRYRTLYLSQVAVALFVAASPRLRLDPRRRTFAKTMAAVALACGLWTTTRALAQERAVRHELLYRDRLAPVVDLYPERIDAEVVEEVLERYGG
jgi:hypothetical protein